MRYVAALALDQAARNADALPAVEELIYLWKRNGSEATRWTAAAALGYELGLSSVESTLDDLLTLGTWNYEKDSPIMSVAANSIACLLARGAAEPVVRRLSCWLDDQRRAVRDLALVTIIQLARIRVSELWVDGIYDSESGLARWPLLSDRGRWPLLLAIQAEEPKFTDDFADLLWRTIDTARSRTAGLDVLAKWMRCRDREPSYLQTLASFLVLLSDTPESAQRLRSLVAKLRKDLQRPLAPDIADHLDAALSKTRIMVQR